jgi:hypothetical protein
MISKPTRAIKSHEDCEVLKFDIERINYVHA